MLNSINTNNSALIAQQALGRSKSTLATTERRVSTGQAVASSKDNGWIWAVAQGQRSQSKALDAVVGGLQRAKSILDVALTGGQQLSELMVGMKQLLLGFSDASLSTQGRQGIANDYNALIKRWANIVYGNETNFDGSNLLSTDFNRSIIVPLNTSGTDNFVFYGGGDYEDDVSLLPIDLTLTDEELTTRRGDLDQKFDKLNLTFSKFGTAARVLDKQIAFSLKLKDAIDTGVGNLVDADMGKESAKLVASQAKQQLGAQALSVASQSTAYLQSLFR
jgi:flagellin